MFAKLALGSVAAQLALGAAEEDFMAKERRLTVTPATTNAAITDANQATNCPAVLVTGATQTPVWTNAQNLEACNQTHCAWGTLLNNATTGACLGRTATQAACAPLTTEALCVLDTNICVWDSAVTPAVCKAPVAVTASGSGAAVPKAVGGAAIVATLLFHLL